MGPHGIPRSCQLSGQSCNGGSFEAQLSDLPADHPHTQTRPWSTHRVVLLNESHDPAGAFAAYPSALKPPEPSRDPGPGCVDHLHHHAPVALSNSPRNPGSQPADCTTQHRVPEPVECEPHSSDGSPPSHEQITPNTTIKRHGAAAGRADTARGPLKIAGVEVRSSPGTSTSTRNPQPTPTHPHSTRKSQFDRGPGSARGRLRHVRARGAAPEDERIKRDGQGPARPGRSAPRTHAPRPRGGGGARRGACAPRSRHPCVT